jgi:hypothetical protein
LRTVQTEPDSLKSKVISYLPKSKVKLTPASFINNQHKITSLIPKEKEKKFEGNSLFNRYQIANTKKEDDNIKVAFKTSYMLKFAKNMDRYDKLVKKLDCLSGNTKNITIDNYYKIKGLSENKDHLLFERLSHDSNSWKDCVKLFFDFETYWLNIAEVILKELIHYNQSNFDYSKKNGVLDNINENYKREIDYLKKYIEDNDIEYKAMIKNKGIKEVDSMKRELAHKEKMSLNSISKLEEE